MSDQNCISSISDEHIYLSQVSPKDKPWDKHRTSASKVGQMYQNTDFDRYAGRIADCSGLLEFAFIPLETGEVKLKLVASRFCRVRHCPVCQWRRQLLWRARFFQALPKITSDYPKARFLFLTLTVRNCPIQELRSQIVQMNQGWKRFSQKKVFPALGWLRTTEVTRSTLGDAHPHFHAILMVNQSYFKKGYLSYETWRQLWRDCLRLDYDPMLNIQSVKNTTKNFDGLNEELLKGFCEVIKYSLKPEDLLPRGNEDISKYREWLVELTSQMHKTRSISVGGCFKSYMSEKEPEDLIGEDEDSDGESGASVYFKWLLQQERYVKSHC